MTDEDRAIDISKLKLEITEANRLYLTVGKFDILINHTHEGLIIDVKPWVAAEDIRGYTGEAIATLCVSDDEADEALEANWGEVEE